MPLIGSPHALAIALKDIIVTNQNAWGVAAVYYGDQLRIPYTPTICVESGPKDRELAGVPRRVNTTLQAYILIYHGLVNEQPADTRALNDSFVDQVEAALDADDTLGGKLVHGFCSNIQPGYVQKVGKLMVGTRITYLGVTREQLPL